MVGETFRLNTYHCSVPGQYSKQNLGQEWVIASYGIPTSVHVINTFRPWKMWQYVKRVNFKVVIQNDKFITACGISEECNRTPLMYVNIARYQAITWVNADRYLCRHMTSLGHVNISIARDVIIHYVQQRPDSQWSKANLGDLVAATGLVILLKLDSNLRFSSLCDLDTWWMTSKNNRAPLLYCIKLCASFQSHRWSTGVTVRKRSKFAIFCLVWPWNSTNDLQNQQGTSSILRQTACIISKTLVNSNWSCSPETDISGQNRRFFSRVTLKWTDDLEKQ